MGNQSPRHRPPASVMPPRLPNLSALRGSVQTRLFSSTPAASAPPRNTSPTAALGALGQSMAKPQQTQTQSPQPRGGNGPNRQRPSSYDAVMSALNRAKRNHREHAGSLMDIRDQTRERQLAQEYLKQMPRNWQTGDVYAPHDLSAVEMGKYKKRLFRPKIDIVDTLNIQPKDMYKNFTLVSEFMTTAGHLRTSAHTRLRPVNHRRIAKMVRRAIGMGLHPSTHAHPEILRKNFFPSTTGRGGWR